MATIRTRLHYLLLAALAFCLSASTQVSAGKDNDPNSRIISLAGTWSFRPDPDNKGIDAEWFKTVFAETVKLPGTTDENQKGNKNDKRPTRHLSRPYVYFGPAWYRREIEIPQAWAGKHITLLLERTKNSRIWIDDKFVGIRESLSVPHIYDLSDVLSPGRHTLTVRIDNADKPPTGNCHAVSPDTQTNWNGIVISRTIPPSERLGSAPKV